MIEKSGDPVVVTPRTHKSIFENERVRLLDIRVQPGQEAPMHSHPAYLFYALSPGKVKFTFPDGQTEELEFQAGTVGWREAETHAAENSGSAEVHVLNIEFKEAQKR